MKTKTEQKSNFDVKKWGVFLIFLVGLALAIFILVKPEGEEKARVLIDEARGLNRQAEELAEKSNLPQDMANLDLSSDALSKANVFFIESEFSKASEQATQASVYARKVISRDAPGNFGAKIRFSELVGDVAIRKQDSELFEPVNDQITLTVGDELRTGPGSACKLMHKDGVETIISANTRLTLQEDFDQTGGENPVAFYLDTGSVFLRTTDTRKEKFNLLSRAGKARVYQSTEAEIRYPVESGKMGVKVRYGRVDAKSGTRTIVVANNQSLSFNDRGERVEPQNLSEIPVLKTPVRSSKFKVNQNGFAAVALSWQQIASARYIIELANDSLMVDLIEKKENYAATRLELPNLQAGEYFWRVTAVVNGQVGLPSPVSEFEVFASDEVTESIGQGEPPDLNVTSTLVQGSYAIIKGKTDRDATVRLNGEVALVDNESGNWHHVLKLPGYGEHTVNIVAESSSGTIAFKNLSVEIKD